MSLTVPEAAVKSSCRETDQESGDRDEERDETVEGRQESAPLLRPVHGCAAPTSQGLVRCPSKNRSHKCVADALRRRCHSRSGGF